jgi:hypothetical protein
MAVPVELTVVTLPEIALAFTNFVYVSKSDGAFLPYPEVNYISILNATGKDIIFIVKAHPKIEPGCIGLGKHQRQTLVPDGATPPKLLCKPVTREKRDEVIDAIEVNFSLNLLKAIKVTEISESQLADFVLETFSGQVLHKKQILYCLYNQIPCELRVEEIKCPKVAATPTPAAADKSQVCIL